jgi:hypothetical protein
MNDEAAEKIVTLLYWCIVLNGLPFTYIFLQASLIIFLLTSNNMQAKMREIVSQEPPSESNVFTQGSIQWALDDAYAQVMGVECSARVRGMGLGPTPGRSRSYTSEASTSSSNETELLSKVNELQAQMLHMQTMHQNQISEMRRMLQAYMDRGENSMGMQDPATGSPPVRPRSSVGSRPGMIVTLYTIHTIPIKGKH